MVGVLTDPNQISSALGMDGVVHCAVVSMNAIVPKHNDRRIVGQRRQRTYQCTFRAHHNVGLYQADRPGNSRVVCVDVRTKATVGVRIEIKHVDGDLGGLPGYRWRRGHLHTTAQHVPDDRASPRGIPSGYRDNSTGKPAATPGS